MSMNDLTKKVNKNLRKKISKNKAEKTVKGSTTKTVNPAREKKLLEEQRRAQIDEQARLEEFNKRVDYSKTVAQQKQAKQAEDERELIDNRVNHKRVIVSKAAADMKREYDLATDDSKGVLDDLGQGHVIDQIEAEAHNLGSTDKTIRQQFKPKIDKINATTKQEEKKEEDFVLDKIEEDIKETTEEAEDDISPLSSRRRRYE